jgi:hypothetical protein
MLHPLTTFLSTHPLAMLSLTVFTTLSLAWCTMAAPLQLESRDMGKYTNDIEVGCFPPSATGHEANKA